MSAAGEKRVTAVFVRMSGRTAYRAQLTERHVLAELDGRRVYCASAALAERASRAHLRGRHG